MELTNAVGFFNEEITLAIQVLNPPVQIR